MIPARAGDVRGVGRPVVPQTHARTHTNPIHMSVRQAGKMNVLFNDTYIQLRRLRVGRGCIMHVARME